MEPGKLIPLLLIGLYYLVTAYMRQRKNKTQQGQSKPVQPLEENEQDKQEEKPQESLQEVLRRLSEQSRQEQQKKVVPTPKPAVKPVKKIVPEKPGPVMKSRIVENIKQENPTTAYDTPKFEHTDSSLITVPGSETQMPAFDIKQAIIASVILNRPEW